MTSRTQSRPLDPPPLRRSGASDAPRGYARAALPAVPAAAVLAMLGALLAAGAGPEPVAPGLPDAGPVTGWGLPLARLAFDLSAVAVVGALVTALLLPATSFAGEGARVLRVASWSACAWIASAAALLLLTVSDVLGVPLGSVLTTERFLTYAWQLALGPGLFVAVGCGVLVATYSLWVRSRFGAAVLLAVAVGGLLPVLFAGHSAAAADHDLATSSLVVHVVAASAWVGGLAGMLLLRRTPRLLAEVLPRYSVVALGCFVAVACSGVLNVWLRTSGDLALWAGSAYGALVVAKVAALVGLGCFGWAHRRRSVVALTDGEPRAFARLATAEVLVMAATVGIAVALSRVPPPAGAAGEVPAHGSGHPTLGSDVEPFTLARLVTEWRPEAISLALVAVGFACYLGGVRRLRRAGVSWPLRRLAAAAAATAVALVATSGGLATYSTATFSLQVTQFLVLFVAVPALAALSAPVTLALAATRPTPAVSAAGAVWNQPVSTQPVPRGVAWLADPLNTLIVATVMLFALYATPLLEASLRSAPLHLFVNLFTLAVGCLFWWSVLGVDAVARSRHRAYRLWVLAGFLLLLGGVGARIYLSEVLLAGTWFTELGWSWVELPDDQRRGAALMWVGVVVLGPLLALLTRARPTTER